MEIRRVAPTVIAIMTRRIFTPAHPPLVVPGTNDRVLRRPDLRDLVIPRLSGAPLTNEVDYDDLIVHRNWRSFDTEAPDQVKYFMFELSQRDPGSPDFSAVFYKAVRMIRLTRVPRYLRQATASSGPNMVFEQMRDVLAALREQGVLFVNVIAKSPQLPLVFAYGVQGVGRTPQEAQQLADEAFAVLDFQLSGTYQQLMYRPINVEEGELISRYQSEWRHLAMGRGRPMPAGGTIGASSLLDGNRTDIESTNNQLESFIRGMSDKSFMLTLVTVPLAPAQINGAWRNITQKLTEVRSETTGTRAVTAGIAFPLTVGANQSDSHGATHTAGTNYGSSVNEGTSASVAETAGINRAFTDSMSQSIASGQTVSITDSTSSSLSNSGTIGESHSASTNSGVNVTNTASSSASLATGSSVGQNWSNSVGQSIGTSMTQTDGWSQGSSTGTSSSNTSGSSFGDSSSINSTTGTGSGVSGGIPLTGFGGNNSSSSSSGVTSGSTSSVSNSNTSGTSASNSSGVSGSLAQGVSQGLSFGESFGGSITQNATATNTVGNSVAVGTNQSVGATHGFNTSQATTAGLTRGQSFATAESLTETLGVSRSSTYGESQSLQNSQGTNRSVGTNQGYTDSNAVSLVRATGSTGSLAVAPNFGVSVSRNTFDAGKQYIGDLLEAQMRRYDEGIKSGAFLYQMFLICPDRETVLGGAGLLKSAFWGAGTSGDKLPQPFHTIVDFDGEERDRLLTHAGAFTSYRKRNPFVEMIEPFTYSTYLTPTEGAALVHPPTVEGPGLLAVHDSMPVLRIPTDRQNSEIPLGYVVNGERGVVSDIRFGVDLDEMKNHALIAGVTGSGKTTTLMRMLTEAVKIERDIVEPATPERPWPVSRKVQASVLALDWMRNMRNLASLPGLVESRRFRFYSLIKPELGEFRWNPLEVPASGMTTAEWLNAQADNFTASFNLGEYGRSLIAEFLTDLYGANRLEPYVLRPEIVDEYTGLVMRPAVTLPPIARALIPEGGIITGSDGKEIANAFTSTDLSRCVSMAHLATLVAAKIEALADPNAKRLYGPEMSNRLQSLWRRMQYFAPGGQYERMLSCDPDPVTRHCLGVVDLIDPDRGLVTVLETDGLDIEARRLVLGSVLLSIYRYGLYHGNGVFDHNGKGPGCWVVMEESHELFGEAGRNEDAYSAATRTALYESMFRRVRALGLRLVAVAQEPSKLPESVTANINNVFIHKVRAKEDRDKVFSLLNWSNMIGQNLREWRYLGEMGVGYCIARLDAVDDFTESAPIQFRTDPPVLGDVSDADIVRLNRR